VPPVPDVFRVIGLFPIPLSILFKPHIIELLHPMLLSLPRGILVVVRVFPQIWIFIHVFDSSLHDGPGFGWWEKMLVKFILVEIEVGSFFKELSCNDLVLD
jgi:hypothetical protein